MARLYQLREDYFREIDSAEKAYFLGLIFADGCITKGRLTLGLHEADKHILESFNQALYLTDHPLYYRKAHAKKWRNGKTYTTQVSYALTVFSQTLVADLARYGCVSCKTDVIRFPFDTIPQTYYRDFIRGYFDGDGCIVRSGTKYKATKYVTYVASFCGNDLFAKDLQQALRSMGMRFNLGRYTMSILSCGDKPTIYEFYRACWYDGCLCLHRKRDKLKEFEAFYLTHKKNRRTCDFENVRRAPHGFDAVVQVDRRKHFLGCFKEQEPAALTALAFREFMGVL